MSPVLSVVSGLLMLEKSIASPWMDFGTERGAVGPVHISLTLSDRHYRDELESNLQNDRGHRENPLILQNAKTTTALVSIRGLIIVLLSLHISILLKIKKKKKNNSKVYECISGSSPSGRPAGDI